ncbi:MAG: serine protease [Mesorhizobium sp.]|uniref:S1 family peptidase n=1 Tax=Mesorhizobium sp. TaxID=1871066 RepID=UPI000FE7ADB1|nr:serine protease [Mesorhizobium sp.]RWM12870.1 MAG: serine protease [Mesorhizobium sp.]
MNARLCCLPVLIALWMATISIASAQDFKAPKGEHWVAVASTQDINNAIGIARYFGRDARAVRTRNGWFAVVLEPRKGTIQEIRKKQAWLQLPGDAFLADGKFITEMVWAPRDAVLAQTTLRSERPAVVTSGRLTVVAQRRMDHDGWTAHLNGQIDGRQAFDLSYTFETAADYPSTLQLVHLNKNNEFPDVVFDANTGGAHCCVQTMAVTPDLAGHWAVVDLETIDGGGPNFEDVDGDGVAEIVHGDNGFLYLFAPYVESFQPILIKKLVGDGLRDVSLETASRPRLIQDTRGLEFMAKVDSSLWNKNGFLAAWVADKVRIDEGVDAWNKMLQAYQRDTDFGVSKCEIDEPVAKCPLDKQRVLPFPEGLSQHLQEAAYTRAYVENTPAPDPASAQSTPRSPQGGETAATGTSGTGFFVSGDQLLTNAHVVKGCDDVDTSIGGIRSPGKVMARDPINDLAVVKVNSTGAAVAQLRGGARLGEDIAVFGFPLRGILASSGNFTRGTITAMAGLGDDSRYFQISAPVQPGNSGGPLVDRNGNVVGIVVSKIDALKLASITDDIAQNVNFAVKASIVESFLQASGVQFSSDPAHQELAPEDLAAKAQSISVPIECRPRMP